MLTSIMFYIISLSLAMTSGESMDSIKTRNDYMKDRLELRIVAEKIQSLENGIKFSVELENKLAEPLSFRVRTRGEMFQTLNLRPDKEKDHPFLFNIWTSDKSSSLAKWYLSNIDDLTVKYNRRIEIDGNSSIELGSVVFREYADYSAESEQKEKIIIPGTYIIEAIFNGYVVVKDSTDDMDEFMINVFAMPIEVVLE